METKEKTQTSGSSFKKQSPIKALSWAGALIVLFSGCSAQWHYERACKKDTSYCAQVMVIDTFVVRDTFEYHRVDTTELIDTITIDTGSVQVRIIRENNIIRTMIKQKPDTAFLTITKTIPPRIVYKECWFKWWYSLILVVIALLVKIKL
jgi:hypothetical protein